MDAGRLFEFRTALNTVTNAADRCKLVLLETADEVDVIHDEKTKIKLVGNAVSCFGAAGIVTGSVLGVVMSGGAALPLVMAGLGTTGLCSGGITSMAASAQRGVEISRKQRTKAKPALDALKQSWEGLLDCVADQQYQVVGFVMPAAQVAGHQGVEQLLELVDDFLQSRDTIGVEVAMMSSEIALLTYCFKGIAFVQAAKTSNPDGWMKDIVNVAMSGEFCVPAQFFSCGVLVMAEAYKLITTWAELKGGSEVSARMREYADSMGRFARQLWRMERMMSSRQVVGAREIEGVQADMAGVVRHVRQRHLGQGEPVLNILGLPQPRA